MIERACIVALASILFYSKTLCYRYSSDDIPASQRPKHPNKLIEWFWVLEGRARSWHQADHAITMAIHTLTSVFIYLGFGSSDMSFLAALLFCFNPANNQASVWISGRSYALPALGMTAALAIPVIGPILVIMAAYYNVGFFAPMILAGSPHPWLALALPIAWLIYGRRFYTNVKAKVDKEMYQEDRTIKPEKLVLFTKTIGFYFLNGLIPIKTTFYHSFLQSAAGVLKDRAYTMKCRYFWIGVAVLGFIAYWIGARPWDMSSFGLAWWLFCIAPFCNFIRIQQEIAERYMYLPNVGLMVFLASLIAVNPILGAVFVTMYATRTWFYIDAFQDDYFLTEYANLNSPDSWFAWHVKAMKRWELKSHQEAVLLWTTALQISPKEFKLNLNLATALALGKHHEPANKLIAVAEANIPAGQEAQAMKLIKEWHSGNMAIVL